MSEFIIEGGHSLSGTVDVYGSKNAALPLMVAGLLSSSPVTLHNIPAISDVARLCDIMTAGGATCERNSTTLTINASSFSAEGIPNDLVGMLRGSILLLGPLLGRFRYAKLPMPGGDIIGARPIDAHLDAFTQLGATVTQEKGIVTIDGSHMKAGEVTLKEFSVTATENVLLVAALLPGTTTVHIAAAEPHVVALAELLTHMGARVSGAGTHTITIEGVETLQGADYTNIPDMLEAGFFILLAAATGSEMRITHVPLTHLRLFFKKIDDIGIAYTIENEENDIATIVVHPSQMKSFTVQTLPYPGIPTDLQATFSVIATQVTGSSLIHDPMYEGRFKHVIELEKMGADVTVCDPHRVIITGPTPLHGHTIPSLDIRSGATLLMAGLVAEGTTTIADAEIIDRGYANLLERLRALGAQISRT